MDLKRDCICCRQRLKITTKRPANINSLRIFISARLYFDPMPVEGYICDQCRWLYKKWFTEFGLCKVLTKMDSLSEEMETMYEERHEKHNGNDLYDELVRTLCLYLDIQQFFIFIG